MTRSVYIYEGVIVPTELEGAEAWGIRSAERRKVNVPKMKCLRSLVGVSQMDRVRNEEMSSRAGIERELTNIEMVLTYGKNDENRMARRVFMAK